MDSTPTREWLLEGLPARNRFLMKHLNLGVPRRVKIRWIDKLLIKAWRLHLKLYKETVPPNEKATHEHWDHVLPMLTPTTQIRMLHEQAKGPRAHSNAVAWGKAVLAQTDGRSISLVPGIGPNGLN